MNKDLIVTIMAIALMMFYVIMLLIDVRILNEIEEIKKILKDK